MIYTSYFARLKKLPNNMIPISICAKTPSWYNGLEYKKLAPSYSILMEYKSYQNEELYIKRFKEEVLNKLCTSEVLEDLFALKPLEDKSKNLCLVCYEKSSDFCHRHLVAEWLKENGYDVEEVE